MYKDLIRVMFNETPTPGGSDSLIAIDAILPIERKINTLIMRINDNMEEIESATPVLSKDFQS